MTLLLIRHGETVGNASRTVQLPDNPLSARGLAQAERLAQRLAAVGIVHIVSSDFAHARSTAELGLDMFAPDYAPPNGESWPVFHARVDRAWGRVQALAATADGDLAVVTHGLVCRSLAERHLLLPDGQVAPERWENTSLTIVGGPAPWRVRLLNCVAHLDDLDAAPLADSGAV